MGFNSGFKGLTLFRPTSI